MHYYSFFSDWTEIGSAYLYSLPTMNSNVSMKNIYFFYISSERGGTEREGGEKER